MSELRDELVTFLSGIDLVAHQAMMSDGYPSSIGHTNAEAAARAVDALLARYAILPLPTAHEDGTTTYGVPCRRWKLPHDYGVITVDVTGVIDEGTSGYWNTRRGDDPELFAAALVAAARYARGEGQ